MRRLILFDECTPIGLRPLLVGHDVKTSAEMGWAGISNGRLLDAAERAGFGVLVTGDKNMRFQQRLAGRQIALVVLGATHWPTIRQNPHAIIETCGLVGQGALAFVPVPQPPLRRRIYSPPEP